jgi:hypothetical protein
VQTINLFFSQWLTAHVINRLQLWSPRLSRQLTLPAISSLIPPHLLLRCSFPSLWHKVVVSKQDILSSTVNNPAPSFTASQLSTSYAGHIDLHPRALAQAKYKANRYHSKDSSVTLPESSFHRFEPRQFSFQFLAVPLAGHRRPLSCSQSSHLHSSRFIPAISKSLVPFQYLHSRTSHSLSRLSFFPSPKATCC